MRNAVLWNNRPVSKAEDLGNSEEISEAFSFFVSPIRFNPSPKTQNKNHKPFTLLNVCKNTPELAA